MRPALFRTTLITLSLLYSVILKSGYGFLVDQYHRNDRFYHHPKKQLQASTENDDALLPQPTSRRQILHFWSMGTLSSFLISSSYCCGAFSGETSLTLKQPGERLGLELYDVTIGSPPVPTVAVKSIQSWNGQNNPGIQPGMVLRDYGKASEVVKRIQEGPYPITLTFRNLAAGGDALSADDGKPLVTAEDALSLARKTSSDVATDNNEGTNSRSSSSYKVEVLQDSSNNDCAIQSTKGDILEIDYEAYYYYYKSSSSGNDDSAAAVLYDSSAGRGTGQPYFMVLGSGDMLSGVDLGLYDMCPGQERGLTIPPALAYGAKGNKLYNIPPNAVLYWKVKLISIPSRS